MSEDRISRALERIEGALARVEARLRAAPSDSDIRARLADLEVRHDTLKQRTAAAVDRLSGILERSGGG